MARTNSDTNHIDENEFVKLQASELGINLYGELRRKPGEEFCVTGIISGVDDSNVNTLMDTMHISGESNKYNYISLEHVFYRSINIRYGGTYVDTFRLVSSELYEGDFDPRSKTINHASFELPTSHWLSDRRLPQYDIDHHDRKFILRGEIQPTPISIYSDRDISISIEYRGSFGASIEYNEVIVIESKCGAEIETIDFYTDAICIFVSVLTQAKCWPSKVKYICETNKDVQSAYKEGVHSTLNKTHHAEWLIEPGKIIDVIISSFPAWIKSLEDPAKMHLAKVFVNSANKDGYIEDRFLRLCHCFEGLNSLHAGDSLNEINITPEMRKTMDDCAKNSGLNSAIRRKMLRSIDDLNKPNLDTRFYKLFDTKPHSIKFILDTRQNIFEEIQSRRNQLSHGSSTAAIRSQPEFESFHTEEIVARVYALSEILLLAGLPKSEISRIVNLDIELRHALH